MLSDFDLSKQSGEPGGAPALIRTSASTGVCGGAPLLHFLLLARRADLLLSDAHRRYPVVHCRLPDKLVRRDRGVHRPRGHPRDGPHERR